MKKMSIMVVDNEKLVAQSIADMLEVQGYHARPYYSAKSALTAIHSKGEQYDVIITDINMPVMDGYAFIEEIQKKGTGNQKILVLTGYGSIDSAVKAIKLGAAGYFEKDRDPEFLLFEIKKIEENLDLQEKMNSLEKEVASSNLYLFNSNNPGMRKIFELSLQVASKEVSILITGESGTGKEILARYIHQNSMRKDRGFLSVNCSAIPDTLFESGMFGHLKGSFTGADSDKTGFFEKASGGTIMLDEIGELPPMIQAKLLKALEEKIYYPVGSTKAKTIDSRIISATNQNLKEKIADGSFRLDFFTA